MTFNQNPFSIYDFLGYLIPGIIFATGVVLLNQNPYYFSLAMFSLFNNAYDYFFILILCYLLGHLTSYLSSITIEKYSIWTLGYPSKYLFNLKHKSFWKSIYKEDKRKEEDIATRGKVRFSTIFAEYSRIIIKLIISLIILPVTLFDIFIRHFLQLKDQYSRPFDDDLLSFVENRMKKMLNSEYKQVVAESSTDDQDYFRIIYHYAIEKCPNHVGKMQNYVALYGFARTTCFIFNILFWVCIIAYVQKDYIHVFWYIPVILGLIALILYIDFNKFYRKFSVEAYMASTTFVSNS